MLQYGKLRDGRVLHRSTRSLLNLLVVLDYKFVYTCYKIGINFIKYVRCQDFKIRCISLFHTVDFIILVKFIKLN